MLVTDRPIVHTIAHATKNTVNKNSRSNADSAWKEMLRLYLPDFFAFFWPEVYADIDWSKPYELLEQELLSIAYEGKIDKCLCRQAI